MIHLAALVAPIAIAAGSGSAFLVNEWTHGGLAEAAGLGHHHVLDYGGYHCAGHDDARLGAAHMIHMHGAARPDIHDRAHDSTTTHPEDLPMSMITPHETCSPGTALHDTGGDAVA